MGFLSFCKKVPYILLLVITTAILFPYFAVTTGAFEQFKKDYGYLWQGVQPLHGTILTTVPVNLTLEPVVSEPEVSQPTFKPVEEAYFANTLFIGDSRTQGLSLYGGFDSSDFFCDVGLTIWTLFEDSVEMNGSHTTLESVLQAEKYDHIYLMLGINELGRGTTSSFAKQYEDVLQKIRYLQPNAVIVIQSILHVTPEAEAKSSYIKNATINQRNQAIAALENGKDIFYLDVNAALDGPDGTLREDITSDGVHIKASSIGEWEKFLRANGIEAVDEEPVRKQFGPYKAKEDSMELHLLKSVQF